LDKQPPEFLTAAELDAIEVGSELWRAVFLQDELGTRAGAVLAKRNADRLKEASALIQAVLADAKVDDDADRSKQPARAQPDYMPDPNPAEPDAAAALLRSLTTEPEDALLALFTATE